MTADKLNEIRKSLKDMQPLIHCITNPISINQCANAILAVGACPIMAEHPYEAGEITCTAQALLLNLGNITDARMKSMMLSSKAASENKIPFVIDLVGVACSHLRRSFAYELLEESSPSVLKGNYSEIYALYNSGYKTAGVDAEMSLNENDIAKTSAKLAQTHNAIILASGKTDIVTDGKKIIYIKNGTPQLTSITGTGCMLGALCSCYLSAYSDISAIVTACAVLGISGELSQTDKGSGSFMINLIDSLSALSDTDIENYLKTEEKEIEGI